MRIEQLMTKFPKTCGAKFSLGEAARLMLENRCGSLPVVAQDGSGRLVGMITDRDICMAAQRGRKDAAGTIGGGRDGAGSLGL